jgi:hypothetical protein
MTSYLDQAELGAERCDLAFENEEADRRRAVFALDRRHRLQAVKAERQAMSLDDRLDAVIFQILRFATPGAASLTRSSRSSEVQHVGPPLLSDMELGHMPGEDVERHFQGVINAGDRDVAARHLEALEHAVDVHRGLDVAQDFSDLQTEEKDRIIIEQYEAFSPDEVYAIQPELGKPRAIRWSRRRNGYDSETGALRVAVAA